VNLARTSERSLPALSLNYLCRNLNCRKKRLLSEVLVFLFVDEKYQLSV
jgi:hypothetical protein